MATQNPLTPGPSPTQIRKELDQINGRQGPNLRGEGRHRSWILQLQKTRYGGGRRAAKNPLRRCPVGLEEWVDYQPGGALRDPGL
jgi:hypothetical protein